MKTKGYYNHVYVASRDIEEIHDMARQLSENQDIAAIYAYISIGRIATRAYYSTSSTCAYLSDVEAAKVMCEFFQANGKMDLCKTLKRRGLQAHNPSGEWKEF